MSESYVGFERTTTVRIHMEQASCRSSIEPPAVDHQLRLTIASRHTTIALVSLDVAGSGDLVCGIHEPHSSVDTRRPGSTL